MTPNWTDFALIVCWLAMSTVAVGRYVFSGVISPGWWLGGAVSLMALLHGHPCVGD